MRLPGSVVFLVVGLFQMEEARADDYKAISRNTVRSPKGSFRIEQRARDDGANGWLWQAWVCPSAVNGKPCQLSLWHDCELSWPGIFSIAPDERHLLHIQKTGSGDNYAELFVRGMDGRFHTLHKPGSLSLSDEAWVFFQRVTGLKLGLYHDGAEFLGWEADGESIGLSLHGSDLGEEFHIRSWRLHYNMRSAKFFLTKDDREANRRAVAFVKSPRLQKPAGKP